MSSLRMIPASFFGMPLGPLALGIAWQSAAGIWPVPPQIGEVLIWAAALLWAFLFVAYFAKWVWQHLFAAGNLVIAVIAVVTVVLALSNQLLPTPLQPHS
jgi:tellurite resistance protein TehA-like permease